VVNFRDYLRKGGTIVKTIIVILALLVFAVLSFLIIQSGYGLFVIVGAVVIGLGIAGYFFFQAWNKYKMVDVLQNAFVKL